MHLLVKALLEALCGPAERRPNDGRWQDVLGDPRVVLRTPELPPISDVIGVNSIPGFPPPILDPEVLRAKNAEVVARRGGRVSE